MAKKLTGRAASVARNKARKARNKASGTKTVVSRGKVAGASLNAAQQGGASGVGFESSSDQEKISRVVEDTLNAGGSKSQGGGSFGRAATRAAELARAKEASNDRKDRREQLSSGSLLATDNLRASNLNRVQDEAITTQGGRSTSSATSARDESKRTGDGTANNPLTERQIQDLDEQGIREGDNVPGKGFLTPLGTFQSETDRQVEQLSTQAENLANKDIAPTDNITVSDESIVVDENSAVDTVNESAKVVRDLTYLDDEISRIQDELKDEMEAINAQAKVDKENRQGQQSSETGQTSVGLANAGGFLGFSGSATGVLLNLAKSHRAELESLDSRRQQAIFEAQDAARSSQFDLVKLKAQELKDIEQEEYNRKQDYLAQTKSINEKETAKKEKETAKKEKTQTQNSIFNAIQMGIKTPEGIFSALDGEVDIAEISKFLDGIDAGDDVGFKFSPTQNASLLGTGMGIGDINTLKEYINENGYDDKIKSALTPTQRMAVDKIFLPKPTSTKASKYDVQIKGTTLNKISGLGYRPDEIEQIEYVLNNFGVESVLYGEDNPDKRAELAVILGAESSLSSVELALNPPTPEDVTIDIINSMSDEQKTKLKTRSDQTGVSSFWKGKKTDIENMLKAPEMQEQLKIAISNGLTTEEILQALTE